ncbi:MAG: hypothetical protein ACT4OG_03805 [Alphaproteobacteria bacterium]
MALGRYLTASLIVLGASGAALAQDGAEPANYAPQSFRSLPLDRPTEVNGIETVCTGVDSDSRENPLWAEYPLRLEFAAGGRSYVANEQVRISGGGAELEVFCSGPWVLAKLPPGRYQVTASVEGGGTRSATVTVPADGQKRVVLHFPEIPAGESDGSMGPNPPLPPPQYERVPQPDEPLPPESEPEYEPE